MTIYDLNELDAYEGKPMRDVLQQLTVQELFKMLQANLSRAALSNPTYVEVLEKLPNGNWTRKVATSAMFNNGLTIEVDNDSAKKVKAPEVTPELTKDMMSIFHTLWAQATVGQTNYKKDEWRALQLILEKICNI